MDGSKAFLGLLNGVFRMNMAADNGITSLFLKQELYPDAPQADFDKNYDKAWSLLLSACANDVMMSNIETFLQSEEVTSEQASAFTKFWKSSRSKVLDAATRRLDWDSTLQSMSWRVDVNTRTSQQEEVNETVGITELVVKDADSSKAIFFELNRKQLSQLIGDLEKAEALLVQ